MLLNFIPTREARKQTWFLPVPKNGWGSVVCVKKCPFSQIPKVSEFSLGCVYPRILPFSSRGIDLIWDNPPYTAPEMKVVSPGFGMGPKKGIAQVEKDQFLLGVESSHVNYIIPATSPIISSFFEDFSPLPT